MGNEILNFFDTTKPDPYVNLTPYVKLVPKPVYGHMAGKPAQAGWTNAVAAPSRAPRVQIGHAAGPGWTAATPSQNRTPITQIGRQFQPPAPMPAMAPPQFMPQMHQIPQPTAQPQAGIIPEIDMHPRNWGEDQTKGVKYIDTEDERVEKYWVRLGPYMKRRNTPLDTESIRRYFYDKSQDNSRPVNYLDKNGQLPQLGIAVLKNGGDHNTPGTIMHEWAWKSLIWVLAAKPGSNTGQSQGADVCFFSHVGKGDRFHHSSFMAGGSVICAGEWIVKAGHLLKISANSGHYRPPMTALHLAVRAMRSCWHPDTEVLVWNVQTGWEYVDVRVFDQDPTGKGKWKTNPDA